MVREVYNKTINVVIIGLFIIIGFFPMVSGYQNKSFISEKIEVSTFFEDSYITITKPKVGFYYINDVEIGEILDKTIAMVIGPITVTTETSSDIDKAIFFINEMDVFEDLFSPFVWKWNFPFSFGRIYLKVNAYVDDYYVAQDSICVWAFQLKNI
jgi:hypothetical protein